MPREHATNLAQSRGNPVHFCTQNYRSPSLLRRGSKIFFSGGVDPRSNVSAGTELQATAESAGASARYHTQDGRHPGETIFCALLPGVACTPCVTVKMADKILRFSDVYGLAEKYFSAQKSGKVGGCCNHENCFSKRLLFSSEGLSHHYRIHHLGRDRVYGETLYGYFRRNRRRDHRC